MKIVLRSFVAFVIIFQGILGTEKSTPLKRSLGDGKYCEYKITPEQIILAQEDKKNGFGYVIEHEDKLEIVTIHGIVEINHPLIRELLHHKTFKRLEKINQYGTSEYIEKALVIPRAEIGYTRYQHSLGILVLIVRYFDKEGTDLLKAMVSGMLHDLSHTPFSHSTDLLFTKEGFLGKAYQDTTLSLFMKRHGISEILSKYDIEIDDILPEKHPVQEQSSPHLCADRIEYNLYAAYKEAHLNYAQRELILDHLHFENGTWYFDNTDDAEVFARISLWNSEYRWGDSDSYVTSYCLNNALIKLIKLGHINKSVFDCEVGDAELWKLLEDSKDSQILDLLKKIQKPGEYFEIVVLHENETNGVRYKRRKTKNRACKPMVLHKGKLVSLEEVSPSFKKLCAQTSARLAKGYFIKPKNPVDEACLNDDGAGAGLLDSCGIARKT